MKRALLPGFFILSALALGSIAAQSQSPAPVIIQAVTPGAPAPAAPVAPPAGPAAGAKSALQYLQEMQATNAATIKKQEAALETLGVLQKSAEEIKIYSKRG